LATIVGAHPTFDQWATQFGFNGADSQMRANYEQTLAQIAEFEAEADQTATFEVNQFSGMSWAEFSNTMLTFRAGNSAWSDVPMLGQIEGDIQDDGVDWDVTPVKDQGSCGACWAFGTIAGIEAKYKQQTGTEVSLSEQQLLDCDKSCDGQGTSCDSHCNCGCDGGQADWSYGAYLTNQAIYTEQSYPYKGRNGQCQSKTDSGIRITGYTAITSMANGNAMTDAGLAAAVNQGAVVVAIAANFRFQLYSGGVLSNPPTGCALNHQVMVTGYASNYWKIKNSWGAGWGEKGFIRFGRATGGCGPFGLLMYKGVVPTLASSAEVEV